MKTVILAIVMNITIISYGQVLDYEFKNLDYEWVNLQSLKGESLTIVDFWASWCKPCLNAMPEIESLYKSFKDKGVAVIGVNVDGLRNQAKVSPLVSTIGVTYPVVFDPDQELLTDMNATVLPTLVIIDKNGKIVYRHEGFVQSDKQLLSDKINSLISQ